MTAPVVYVRDDAAYVVGVGAQTPVGRSVLAGAAAVRCGISAYAEHPFMLDRHGEPMVVARAPWLDDTLPVEERVAALGADAAREALAPLAERPGWPGGPLPVHVALPAERLPDAAARERALGALLAGAGVDASRVEVDVVADGHAGGLLALERAARRLRAGEAHVCLVGGADSWLDPMGLDALDLAGRLHSVNHSWGFTPGEGAGFVTLATGAAALALRLAPLAELLTVATAEEPKPMGTRTVCTGEGLTAAFLAALDPRRPVAHAYCDFNGETYRADEYGFTVCRTADRFVDAGSFTAGAACWGDVGAASAPLGIGLAAAAWARGYAPGAVQLVWGSSAAGPLRGAALLRAPGAGEG
jgi:3-oxoacyl-[acyl-carrier-protein] synthase-1